MQMLATLALTLLATLATAQSTPLSCQTPAVGTMEDLMAQAVWTTEIGTASDNLGGRSNYNIDFELPALASSAFSCLTYDVNLLLLYPVTPTEDDGVAHPTSYLAQSSSARTRFVVDLAARNTPHGRVNHTRAWIRVQVKDPALEDGSVIHRRLGWSVWLYPVDVKLDWT